MVPLVGHGASQCRQHLPFVGIELIKTNVVWPDGDRLGSATGLAQFIEAHPAGQHDHHSLLSRRRIEQKHQRAGALPQITKRDPTGTDRWLDQPTAGLQFGCPGWLPVTPAAGRTGWFSWPRAVEFGAVGPRDRLGGCRVARHPIAFNQQTGTVARGDRCNVIVLIVSRFVVGYYVESDRCLLSDACQQAAAVDFEQHGCHQGAGAAGPAIGAGAAAFKNHAAAAIGGEFEQDLVAGAAIVGEGGLHLTDPGADYLLWHDLPGPLAVLRFKEMKKTLLQCVHREGVGGRAKE